ncbi:retrovirus-related pol polyprotein from transposon TNT 1-94 [Tanacetum coccineum]
MIYIQQLDVKTAFLHRNPEEEIYMLQLEDFEQKGKENLVCRLNNSLYGLKQASRCWYKRFDSFIRSLEYNRLHAYPYAYFKRFGNNDFIILLLYIDDMLGCPNKDRINKLKAQLAREFEMKDIRPTNKILGMQIHRDRTRLDIAHAMGVVSRYMAEPGREHWESVKRILGYIKGTSDVALCFGDSDLIVNGYVDSDYACDLDGIMAMSTIDAEYFAAAQACKEASALYLARNPSLHSKTKHIQVQYHFVHEKVEEGTVDMQKIHIDDNVADYLMKAINCDKFIWCRSSCGLAETPSGDLDTGSCTRTREVMIFCTIKSKPLALPWGQTPRLDSGVRVTRPRKVLTVEFKRGGASELLIVKAIVSFPRMSDAPAAAHQASGSGSGAGAEVSAPSVEGNVVEENVIPESAFLNPTDPECDVTVAEKDVAQRQPEKAKRKKLLKRSDPLPAKRLRTDHPSLASGTGGKSLASLRQSLPEGSLTLGTFSPADIPTHVTVPSFCAADAPVYTAADTVTSSRGKTLVLPTSDVGGSSQPETSEESTDSFYEMAVLNSEDAKRWYIPRWNITNDSLLDDGFSCRTLVDRVAPPGFFSTLRNMDYDQLFAEFNVGAARQICLGSEVRSRAEHELELKEKLRAKYDARGVLLSEKDAEIARLKSLLKEKETESAEVLRLRDQVSVLAAEKSSLSAEVSALKSDVSQKDTVISLLDSRASHLKSSLDDSQAACDEAKNLISSLSSEKDGLVSEVSTLHSAFRDFKEKMEAQQEEQAQELYNRVAELEAHVMDVSGRLEGEFYPAYLTALAGRRWLLTHGMELAMVKCLKSPEYQGILGHALGRAVDYGMQEGLAAGHEHGIAGTPLSAVVAYDPETAKNNYFDAVRALEEADFPLIHLLKSKKDSGMDEVLDCFLLDGPLANLPEAAYLQPCLEQLSVPIYYADVNAVVGETSLSFALLNVHNRAEGARKHAAALRRLMVDIVSHPLSSQNLDKLLKKLNKHWMNVNSRNFLKGSMC